MIKIGTRQSALSVFQAQKVKGYLDKLGLESELVIIHSDGDKDLQTPLYEMGVQGIFTKALDSALLNKRIDVAVHSLKDVPVQLAKGLRQSAVLERDSYKDILVYNENIDFLTDKTIPATVATSSLRRRAQWWHRYPHHQVENLRGSINLRLEKLKKSTWNGAIFAAAGLERLNIRPENSIDLDWMLPAPAQGAITVHCRSKDVHIWEACQSFNDMPTQICTDIERTFLKTLMGGCTAPIAALATIKKDIITFKGCVLSIDGQEKLDIERSINIENVHNFAQECAYALIQNGADKLISKRLVKD